MKKLSLVLFLLLSFSYLTGQNEISKDQLLKLKSGLEAKKKIIEDSLVIIDKEIKENEVQEFATKYSDSLKFPTKTKGYNILFKEPNIFSTKLAKYFTGDDILVLNYDPESRYLYVKYKDLKGFVDIYGVELTDDIHNLIEIKNQEYELVKIEKKKQLALEKEKKEEQLALEKEQQALLMEQQIKQQAIKQEQKANQRKQDLINKYGTVVAEKIIAGKIWLGMTKEMAIESWGKPEDINRTVTSYSTHEQWVYGNQYLYFDDGILTSWQD